MKGRDIVINIGECSKKNMMEEGRIPDVSEELADCENSVNLARNVSPDSAEKSNKERRMSMSAKKPPRPPRGLSLDAADQKLIKEFAELLAIKRARIERIKALKKAAKAAKASSSSTSSSSGNFIAMLFTILFCIVIIFQGCHPLGIWPRNNSPKSNGATEDSFVAVHGHRNLSTGSVHMLSEVGSPKQVELAPGSDNQGVGGKAAN